MDGGSLLHGGVWAWRAVVVGAVGGLALPGDSLPWIVGEAAEGHAFLG